MKSFSHLCVSFVFVILFSQCSATIDLSNVDLLNFKYFKNLPDLAISKESLLHPIASKVQKAKAVVGYFKNVLLGNPAHEDVKIIEFDPHFGDAWHPHFEHHYGHKGEHLVEALGKGLYHGHYHQEHVPEVHDYGHYHEHLAEVHDHGHYHDHAHEIHDHGHYQDHVHEIHDHGHYHDHVPEAWDHHH